MIFGDQQEIKYNITTKYDELGGIPFYDCDIDGDSKCTVSEVNAILLYLVNV